MNKDAQGRRVTPRRATALQEKSSGPAFEGSLPPSPMMTAEVWTGVNGVATSSGTATTVAATSPEAKGIQGRTITTDFVDEVKDVDQDLWDRLHPWVVQVRRVPRESLLAPAQQQLLRYSRQPWRLHLRHPLRTLRLSLASSRTRAEKSSPGSLSDFFLRRWGP